MKKWEVTKHSEIVEYIERSIVDIARKCNVYTSDVVQIFKKNILL